MQVIADALGVTRAAFYHYASRQDLLRGLAEPVVAAFEDLACRAEALQLDDGTLLEGYLDVVLAHERVLRFVATDPAVQADADVGTRLRDAYGRIIAGLARGTHGPERDTRAACALGAVSAGMLHAADSVERRSIILAAAEAAFRVPGGRS